MNVAHQSHEVDKVQMCRVHQNQSSCVCKIHEKNGGRQSLGTIFLADIIARILKYAKASS
jgi:hypothetical protein